MNGTWKTPWKIWNNLRAILIWPFVRVQFAWHGIRWGQGYRFYGRPIIQKHGHSQMNFGDRLQLRSSVSSNPLAPNHRVFLTTWKAGAELTIGYHFSMTGGIICAAESITIGDRVNVGANSSIIDTDFHPLDPVRRQEDTRAGESAPIVIEDNVFIGMSAIILKSSHIRKGSVIGAGSVVSGEIPPGVIAAGNPARVIRELGT